MEAPLKRLWLINFKKQMDKYFETFETWNKVASLYEENFMNLEVYNESYDLFCNTVHTPNASILEIGCGPGNITKYLSKI